MTQYFETTPLGTVMNGECLTKALMSSLPEESQGYVARAGELLKEVSAEEWKYRNSPKLAKVNTLLALAQPRVWGSHKFNPNHLGPGPGGGQFTTADRAGQSLGLAPGSGKPQRSALKPPSAASDSGTQVAGDDAVPITGPKSIEEETREQQSQEAIGAGEISSNVNQENIFPRSPASSPLITGILEETSSVFKPDGIPSDWIEKSSSNGGGMQWINPDNSNDRVRSMPANPDSPYPWQQVPYVIDQNGGFFDVNGNQILASKPGQTPDAHIPADQYKFRR